MAGLGALELCARLCDDVVLLASVWRVYRKTTPRPSARGVVFAVIRVLEDEVDDLRDDNANDPAAVRRKARAKERRRALRRGDGDRRRRRERPSSTSETPDVEDAEDEADVFGVRAATELPWLHAAKRDSRRRNASQRGVSTWLVDEVAMLPCWRLLISSAFHASAFGGAARPSCWSVSALRATALRVAREARVSDVAGGAAYVAARCALTGALDAPFTALFGAAARGQRSPLRAAYRVSVARPFEAFAVHATVGDAAPMNGLAAFSWFSRRAALIAAVEAWVFDGNASALAVASAVRLGDLRTSAGTSLFRREVRPTRGVYVCGDGRAQTLDGAARHFVTTLELLPLALACIAVARVSALLICGPTPLDVERRRVFEKKLERYFRPRTARKLRRNASLLHLTERQ